MRKVITYGTFDLLHEGHLNLLKRAKSLGDYLIVGVTSSHYDQSRGKLNVSQSLAERIENVRNTGLADEIIVEDYLGQKIEDIVRNKVEIFAIGSDWQGKFDYLKKYCKVVYFPRTPGISSTELRTKRVIRLGIIGAGRIATRFVAESSLVSGLVITAVMSEHEESARKFAEINGIGKYYTPAFFDDFIKEVDAVYIATPHDTHYNYTRDCLLKKKHVLCEKPISFNMNELLVLKDLAESNNLILREALKTAHFPLFNRMINVILSGVIGKITMINASFTKLIPQKECREFTGNSSGSFLELGSYPLTLINKLLGPDFQDISFISMIDDKLGTDLFTTCELIYKDAIARANVGLGVKTEGDAVISGTLGYIYIPAPWWITSSFTVSFENRRENYSISDKVHGDGLRYEINDFIKEINGTENNLWTLDNSLFNTVVLQQYLNLRNEGKLRTIS